MRLLVSKVELAHILTQRIQRFPEGKGSVITPFHIVRCRAPRKDGGNWLLRQITEDGRWLALLRVFSNAFEEFNLEEDSSAQAKGLGPMVVVHVSKQARGPAHPADSVATNEKRPEEAE
jgi:hypothetical protein